MKGLRRTLSKLELDHFTKKEEESTAHVGKEMVTLEPKIVESFHSLRYLSLADNLLTDLPDELSHLHFLKKLNLKNNRFQEFPKCVLKLTNLRGLSIKGNKLREVPSEISQMTSLQMMNFSNNHLVHLPISLLDMNIMKLRINDNPLVFPSSKSVKQGLSAVFEEMKRYKVCCELKPEFPFT